MTAPEWFRRFGDIPGIEWETPGGIVREQIVGHDAQPQRSTYRAEDYWWPIVYAYDDDERASMEDGSSGQAPASQYPMPDGPRTVAEQLRALGEALELPGAAQDYHQLLSDAAE